EVLSRLQRYGRRAVEERGQPRTRRPVGGGRRHLSTGNPAIWRQGRPPAEGRPGGRPDRRLGPVRRPPPVLPTPAGRAAGRGARPLSGAGGQPGGAVVSPGSSAARPRPAAANRRSNVLQLLGRRRAGPARGSGVPGGPIRRGAVDVSAALA